MHGNLPCHGLWHLAGPVITKFDLLRRLNLRLSALDITVVPDDGFCCDRSLNGSAFASTTGYVAPDWDVMLDELAADIQTRWKKGEPSYWPSER